MGSNKFFHILKSKNNFKMRLNLVFFIFLISCEMNVKPTNTNLNFIQNQSYFYETTSKSGVDTLVLSVADKKCEIHTTQYAISWSAVTNLEYDNLQYTGIIINKNRIWVHPPRFDVYNVLEFCPFPEIRTPLKSGTEWKDSLLIGGNYSNKRGLEFEGQIMFFHNYKIVGETVIKTKFGKLTCWEVVANGKSKIAKSATKLYYNEKYGFVKMEFYCVDESTITMNLVEIKPFQTNEKIDFLKLLK